MRVHFPDWSTEGPLASHFDQRQKLLVLRGEMEKIRGLNVTHRSAF
jgi:hypothetical protein